jgi:hypothetical protein
MGWLRHESSRSALGTSALLLVAITASLCVHLTHLSGVPTRADQTQHEHRKLLLHSPGDAIGGSGSTEEGADISDDEQREHHLYYQDMGAGPEDSQHMWRRLQAVAPLPQVCVHVPKETCHFNCVLCNLA